MDGSHSSWSCSSGLRLMMMVQNFHLGGTEGQAVELLRKLPDDYRTTVGCVIKQGPHLQEVIELGIEPLEFGLDGSFAQPNTGKQIWRLAHELRSRKIELVHAQDFYSTLLAVPASKLARCRVIVGRLDMGHWPTGVAKKLLALSTALADGVIANARAIRDRLVDEEHLSAGKVRVIPNGIDLKRFDRLARAGLTEPLPDLSGRRVFVQVANMTHPVKAQEDLLAALRVLKHDHPELLVLLVGSGARRNQLERLSVQLGVERMVSFVGSRTDIPALLGVAHAGLLTSRAEGLSNALIEYMAAGLPAIATRVGGNGEIVAHHERGLLVPASSPYALASAMEQVLRQPERARTWGRNGRAFVENELTTELLAERHDRFYREVLVG
jgi:glycosyltransferase involved in cell wall biosynthesis